jgi:hypothetical protein
MSSTFDEYRAQIEVAFQHARELKLSAEDREIVGVGIRKARNNGTTFAEEAPRWANTAAADKVAQPIVDQLNDADRDLSADDVVQLEATVAEEFARAPTRPN